MASESTVFLNSDATLGIIRFIKNQAEDPILSPGRVGMNAINYSHKLQKKKLPGKNDHAVHHGVKDRFLFGVHT